MKRLFINQVNGMKPHAKVAESEFSNYYGRSNFDGEPALQQMGVGKIGANSLSIRIVTNASIDASGEVVNLFGATDNIYTAGNNINANATVTGKPNTYAYILGTSLSKPYVVKGMKILVGGATPTSQLNQSFVVSKKSIGGRATSETYFPSDFFDPMQNQAGAVNLTEFEEVIDGDTTLSYTVLPSQTIDLVWFIKSQTDPSRVAEGKHSLKVSDRAFPTANQQTILLK